VFNLTESEKQNRVVDLIDVVKDQVRQTDVTFYQGGQMRS
jgi:hypothetical protein